MPERATIAQNVQLGPEVTPGVAVAATKRLKSISLSPSVRGTFRSFRPQGTKYPSVVYPGKEWSESDVGGDALYSELQYPFASVITTPTVAQLMDGATPTSAYEWIFDPLTIGEDTPKTYTVEQGSGVRAHRASNFIFSEFSLQFSRESVELGGTAFGKAIEDGITLTGGATGIPEFPVIPTQLSVYMDTTSAGIGTTKLGRVLSGGFSIASRFAPLWVVDAQQPSFAATIEVEPEVRLNLVMEADAQGMALLNAMRGAATRFLRLEAVGEKIYNGAGPSDHEYHRLNIDVAGKIGDEPPFSDQDGVYAVEFTFSAVHDEAWGRAFRVLLHNKQSAL